MTGNFTSFVILGAMRTGSNFLEASLSDLEGVTSYGEVFNPRFIGRQNCRKLFGVDLAARDADPMTLLSLLRAKSGDMTGLVSSVDTIHGFSMPFLPILPAPRSS